MVSKQSEGTTKSLRVSKFRLHAIDVIIIISTIQFSVYKQQYSYMNRSMVSWKLYTCVLVCHES